MVIDDFPRTGAATHPGQVARAQDRRRSDGVERVKQPPRLRPEGRRRVQVGKSRPRMDAPEGAGWSTAKECAVTQIPAHGPRNNLEFRRRGSGSHLPGGAVDRMAWAAPSPSTMRPPWGSFAFLRGAVEKPSPNAPSLSSAVHSPASHRQFRRVRVGPTGPIHDSRPVASICGES